MRYLVTGAGGFLGSEVVSALAARGHQVLAMRRTSSGGPPPGVDELIMDLRFPKGPLTRIDGVVHCAAQMSGGFYDQLDSTVVGTENLIALMVAAGVRRLVHVSSLAVYDYEAVPAGGILDERVPLEASAGRGDAYVKAKLWQERLVWEAASAHDLLVTVVRPGVVFGRGRLFSDRVGLRVGRRLIVVGGGSHLPLTYVRNCAEALGAVIACEEAHGQALNVVDDQQLTQLQYVSTLERLSGHSLAYRRVPRTLLLGTARVLLGWNRRFLKGGGRLPFELDYRRLNAIYRPLRFTNQALRAVTGWRPATGLEEALAESVVPGLAPW